MSDEPVTADDILRRLPPVTHYLSSGCTLLDLALADRLPGGFPAGRICQIYGNESTGKSVLVQEAIGSAQRQGGFGSLNDAEGTLDFYRAEYLHGMDVKTKKQWDYPEPPSESIEDLFDNYVPATITKALKVKGPRCSVVDSLSAICSDAELDAKLATPTFGTSRAKQLSLAFRRCRGDVSAANLAMLFVDQTRHNVGGYGEAQIASGGEALKFYSSTRLKLSPGEKIENSSKRVVGVKLKFLVRKNKIAPPFREGIIRILFDYGIDDIGTSLDWLHENDPALLELAEAKEADKVKDDPKPAKRERKSDKKLRIPWAVPALELTARTLNDLVDKIEDQNLEEALSKEVERVWRIVYAPITRKQRVRFGN